MRSLKRLAFPRGTERVNPLTAYSRDRNPQEISLTRMRRDLFLTPWRIRGRQRDASFSSQVGTGIPRTWLTHTEETCANAVQDRWTLCRQRVCLCVRSVVILPLHWICFMEIDFTCYACPCGFHNEQMNRMSCVSHNLVIPTVRKFSRCGLIPTWGRRKHYLN